MTRIYLFLTIIITLLSQQIAFADHDVTHVDGTSPGYVYYDKPSLHPGQAIQYLHYHLSSQAQQWLADHIDDTFDATTFKSTTLPSQVSLGMNNVPVSNQGVHGSCVTFAIAGAINAIIGHTQYVSELCNLSLGKYLNSIYPNYPSGWDGSSARNLFYQLNTYGFNSRDTESKYGCAGVYKYPKNNINNTGKPMSIDNFKEHSESITNRIDYHPILGLTESLSDKTAATNDIDRVKSALNDGHRIALGFFLYTDSTNGAHGTYHTKNDSWVITKDIITSAKLKKIRSGHELVITGYDDNAVINGPDCSFHRGVFTLRNSWGKLAGDKGDYYMSYDYFSKMTNEIYELMPAT